MVVNVRLLPHKGRAETPLAMVSGPEHSNEGPVQMPTAPDATNLSARKAGSANTWFLIDPAAMHSLAIMRLTGKQFRAEMFAALDGKSSAFDGFVKGPYSRPLFHDWAVIRARIFERDDYTCTYCGARGTALECDHIVPVARGGDSTDDNLTTACKPCNRSKWSKTVAEWRA